MVKELEDNIGVSFAELLDCKDFNIANHVLRTAEYVELLIRELIEEGTFGDEITVDDIDEIKRAIPFHDIGKIGVSDIILLKRTPLTQEEYQEIYKHTVIGAQVLQGIYNRTPDQAYLKTAIIIAEGHHERYDGAGYPRGLKGHDMPLCCRVMAVANVYDACVTDRIYRKALSHEETCKIIFDGRGTQFDARIVDAFDKVKDKFASLNVSSKLALIDKGWSISYEANPGS
jgi:putative two-component system response regulator